MTHSTKSRRILLVSADREFAQETRAAFATSDTVELVVVEKNVSDLRGEAHDLFELSARHERQAKGEEGGDA